MIFYNELLRIETYRLLIHRKLMMKMLTNEIGKIVEFIKSNREFYQYYSTSQTCMDEAYFVRNNSNVFINSRSLYYLTDPQFSVGSKSIIGIFISIWFLRIFDTAYIVNEIVVDFFVS